MIEDAELFKNIAINGKPIDKCEMVLECNSGNYRLYIDRINNGFYAMALEFVSCNADSIDIWSNDELEVRQLFNLTAYFDGVRHLEFNRKAGDMAGYMNYPDMDGLVELFKRVREIELELCWDCPLPTNKQLGG